MSFKSSWLKALKISLDASVYRDLGFSEDESFSFALTDNSSSVKGAAAISPETLRAIKEAGKKRARELAALEQRHDVLVLGSFRVRRQHHRSCDLPDDRDAVELSDPCGAKLTQGFLFSFLHAATLLRRSMPRRAHLYTFFICGN